MILKVGQFPRLDQPATAIWAPLLLRPILGSPEQVVIAVAVASKDGFHVERANSLDRLECLFGELSPSVVLTAETAIDALTEDLAKRGSAALVGFEPVFEGTALGEIREGEGRTLRQLASSWLAGLSSLHSMPAEIAVEVIESDLDEIAPFELARDRLPALVLDYVAHKRPGLGNFFNEDIRDRAMRRRRGKVHDVIIDFAGSKLVANFGTLSAVQQANSIDRIKRRLWDLEVNRDRETGAIARRPHEMIVQHPAADDPQISEQQFNRIREALEALNGQAITENLSVRSMTTVEQIGEHILSTEAA
jgi:hypothetical protein